MIGVAVFDLDGTLLDSVPLCAEILNAMLADRGADERVTHEDTRRHASGGGEAMVAALLGRHLGDAGGAVAEFRERYAARPTPWSSLFPGVPEGLARLRSRGVALAICSNKPQALCDKVLLDLGLADMFVAVIGGRPGLAPKPDPAALRMALETAGGAPAGSCYVGDSELDHAAARRADVPFILVSYGYADPGQNFAGAHLADRFADAATIAQTLLARRLSSTYASVK